MKRRRRLRLLTAFAALVGLAAAVPIGCFSLKEPPCAFSCSTPPHRCPEQYSCGTEGLCHREGATGICPLRPPDGGGPPVDAASIDGPGGDGAASGDGSSDRD